MSDIIERLSSMPTEGLASELRKTSIVDSIGESEELARFFKESAKAKARYDHVLRNLKQFTQEDFYKWPVGYMVSFAKTSLTEIGE